MSVSTGPPNRVANRQFLLLLVSVVFVSTTFQLVLPVFPIAVERASAQPGSAGIVTGAMALLTITFELLTPRLIAKYPSTRLLTGGLLLMTIAVAGFWLSRSVALMVVLGATIGVGFGVAVTVIGALVGALVPAGRRGEAFGYYGLVSSVPTIFAPSAALLLVTGPGLPAVFAVAAACAAIAAATSVLMTPRPVTGETSPMSYAIALQDGPIRSIVVSFVLVTITYGGIITFASRALPITGLGSAATFLFITGITRALARAATGPLLDRFSAEFLIIPGLTLVGVGLVCLAAGDHVLVIASALLYGTGYGMTQNASFVAMLERMPSGSGVASGLWNFSIDGGLGFGAVSLGPIAAAVGYHQMLWVLPGLILVSMLVRLATRFQSRAR